MRGYCRNGHEYTEGNTYHHKRGRSCRACAIARRPHGAMASAQYRVKRALKSGELQRPTSCSRCGANGFIEAAHENYSDRLAIRWLCRSCHRKWDIEEPKSVTAAGAPKYNLRGEAHPCAKLTEAQVIEIRVRRASGERVKDLATEFGLHRVTVKQIYQRELWGWL